MVENGAKIKHLTDEQKDDLLKHNEGNYNDHNAFYIDIRSGNHEKLENLIKTNDKSPPDTQQSTDYLLAKAYEELKLKGVPLSKDMEFFVEENLINLRFFIERNNQNEKKVESSVENVKKRIETLCDQINHLKKGYMEKTGKDVDGEFILIARFVAQNIHILKRQLKSTYDKLPWEEMEFCVVIFVSSHTKHQEFNVVYKLILDIERLLKHLTNFEETLKKTVITKEDVNSNYPKQGYRDPSARKSAKKEVIKSNSSYQELYNDYKILKDVYSLKRIESYVELASSINLDQKPELGILAIERTLQVIGESLKNTLVSPNVSDTIDDMLADSAPNDLRKTITSLRDLLTHNNTLTKKMEFEDRQNLASFLAIQEDLRKVGLGIGEILYKKKVDAIRIFLKKIISCNDLLEVKKLADIFTGVEIGEIKLEYSDTKEFVKITNMIDELSKIINDKTEEEQGLFNQIYEILDSQKSKLKDVKINYLNRLSTIDSIINQINNNDLIFIKDKCQNLLNAIKKTISTEKLQEVVNLVENICKSVTPKKQLIELNKIWELYENITNTINSELKMIPEINKLKKRLEKKEIDQGVIKKVNLIFSNIEMKIKNEKSKNHFLQKLEEAKLADNGPNGRNAYRTFLDSIKNSINHEKFDNILLHFKSFFRSIIKKKVVENELNEIIDNIFKETIDIFKEMTEQLDTRLKTLADLVESDNLEFIQKCRQVKKMQVAVEMVILDITDILDQIGSFGDNQLFFDIYSPILMGKALRNYLAHGDPLIDTLPFEPSTAVIANALKFITEGKTSLTKKSLLIGQIIRDDFAYLANRYSQSLKLVTNQNEMFMAAKQGNLEKVRDCIKAGADIRAKDIKSLTGVELAVEGDNVEVLDFFFIQSLSVDNEYIDCQRLLDIAGFFGSENALLYLEANGAKIDA